MSGAHSRIGLIVDIDPSIYHEIYNHHSSELHEELLSAYEIVRKEKYFSIINIDTKDSRRFLRNLLERNEGLGDIYDPSRK